MKPVLVISERDNVATALQALEPGRDLTLDVGVVSVRDAVPSGHKIALRVIRAGEAVIKYRQPDRAGDGRDSLPARTCTRTTWRARAGGAISRRPGRNRNRGSPSRPTSGMA